MKASLCIKLDRLVCKAMRDGLPTNGRKPWVAEITGLDAKYELRRAFVRSAYDYTNAAKSSWNGIEARFILESGRYYEVSEGYFCQVGPDGTIKKVDEEVVKSSVSKFEFEPVRVEILAREIGVGAAFEGVVIAPTKKRSLWFSHVCQHDFAASYGVMEVSKKRCRLKGVYVLKKWRGRGLGKAIIQDAQEKLKASDYSELEALVYKPEPYLEAGFVLDEAYKAKETQAGTVRRVLWRK